jgi:hypothetical protein
MARARSQKISKRFNPYKLKLARLYLEEWRNRNAPIETIENTLRAGSAGDTQRHIADDEIPDDEADRNEATVEAPAR